jgi:chromate transporter
MSIVLIHTQCLFLSILGYLAFCVPSLTVMLILGSVTRMNHDNSSISIALPFFRIFSVGLTQSTVSTVLQAGCNLSRKVISSNCHLGIIIGSFLIYLIFDNYATMLILMACGGGVALYFKEVRLLGIKEKNKPIPKDIKILGLPALILFVSIFCILHLLYYLYPENLNITLTTAFYRIGSLVIGGGQVIIPLTINEFTERGLLSEKDILESFALVSLLPGPSPNVVGYLGALMNGLIGGLLSEFSFLLAGFLLLYAALGLMKFIERNKSIQLFLSGISSVAIGFIFTSTVVLWYDSCCNNPYYSAILGTVNFVICFMMLERFPNWIPAIILLGGVNALILYYLINNIY